MEPALRALCEEVLGGDVNGERFTALLFETGVNIEGYEWDVASRLLGRKDEIKFLADECAMSLQ